MTPFGVKTGTYTYTALNDNIVLYRDTTLYCITENINTPRVTWTRKYLNGVTTTLSSTTSSTTGLSILYVSRSNPGFYSCEVEQNGGNSKTYTVLMLAYNQGNRNVFLISHRKHILIGRGTRAPHNLHSGLRPSLVFKH